MAVPGLASESVSTTNHYTLQVAAQSIARIDSSVFRIVADDSSRAYDAMVCLHACLPASPRVVGKLAGKRLTHLLCP